MIAVAFILTGLGIEFFMNKRNQPVHDIGTAMLLVGIVLLLLMFCGVPL